MIKKVRILKVSFTSELKLQEVPAFRGAIIEKVGRQHIIFHHHMADSYLYRYPTIQYKCISHKPAIVCIDEGVDEIHRFFEKPDWSLWIGDKKLEMKVDQIYLNQFTLQVWNTSFFYRINNWVALSQENYKRYKSCSTPDEQRLLLESILTGNILAFAKGVGWTVEKPIEIKILDEPRTRPLPLKGQKVIGFDATFRTNVSLPNFIGLGKSVSLGFGTIKQLNKYDEN